MDFRAMMPKDAEILHEIVGNNRDRLLRSFPLTIAECQTVNMAEDYLDPEISTLKGYIFGVFEQNQLIAVFFAKEFDWSVPKCEIAYFVDSEHERKGVTTIGIQKLIAHCFSEFKMVKIFARIHKYNTGSQRVLEKNGFELEGVLRKEYKIETGELIDLEYYGLLKTN